MGGGGGNLYYLEVCPWCYDTCNVCVLNKSYIHKYEIAYLGSLN